MIREKKQCPSAPRASRAARIASAALLWLVFGPVSGGGFALAQANTIEESGVVEKRGEPASIDDKAFDCAAFRKLIVVANGGFTSIRGAAKSRTDAIDSYETSDPLFGACEIVDKKKLDEVIYSCQAEKLSLADLKATIEACLGDKAFSYAGNENPNTPYLRYTPQVGDAKARVLALTTFGKRTLAIITLR